MNTLVFGFYGEGKADYQFTQEVVRRAIQDILPAVDVLPITIDRMGGALEEQFILLAKETTGYHLAVIHLDADGRDYQQAYDERFKPGYERVQSYNDEVNKIFVPVIPIKVTEAWMLVDFEAFQEITGTKKTSDNLRFPSHPHQVEALPDAQNVFESAVRALKPGKRRQHSPEEFYSPLASSVSLDRLRRVPAFQHFELRLKQVLKDLRFLPD